MSYITVHEVIIPENGYWPIRVMGYQAYEHREINMPSISEEFPYLTELPLPIRHLIIFNLCELSKEFRIDVVSQFCNYLKM